MKHMRKIFGILAVLLLCAAFVGAGSAFTYTKDATVTPAGSLNPGQTVTATMQIVITEDSLTAADTLTLTTPLTKATWTTIIFKGGVPINEGGTHATKISGFELDYAADLTLDITVRGTVPTSVQGQEISVLKIDATAKEANGVYSYSSAKQKVYNPNDFNSDLKDLNSRVTKLESRVVVYTEYGMDTTAVTQKITQSKTKISAAQTAGTTDLITAYANVEAADSLLTDGERTLSLTGLKAANSNIAQIDAAVKTLYSRNWKSEGQLLETRSTSMKYSYDTLAATYNAGGIPDAAKLDALVADSYKTLAEANEYLEKSEGIPLGTLIPFIIGGIVLAGAVVGIVFLIRRRRANSWDELG